jgi:hypothetical protein
MGRHVQSSAGTLLRMSDTMNQAPPSWILVRSWYPPYAIGHADDGPQTYWRLGPRGSLVRETLAPSISAPTGLVLPCPVSW